MVSHETLRKRNFDSLLFPVALTHGKLKLPTKRNIKAHFYRLPPIQQHFIRFFVEHYFEKCQANNVELTSRVFYSELIHYQGKE